MTQIEPETTAAIESFSKDSHKIHYGIFSYPKIRINIAFALFLSGSPTIDPSIAILAPSFETSKTFARGPLREVAQRLLHFEIN
jgi:hypothetical protein